MRDIPDRAPEDMRIDVKRLEELLQDNDIVETEGLSRDFQLTQTFLRRVVDQDVNQVVVQHLEAIDAIGHFTDYTKVAEGLAHLEGLAVSPQGDAFSGYALLQSVTDSHAANSSIGMAIGTDGSVRRVDNKTTVTNQKQVDELVNPMLESLSNRKGDSRRTVRSIIDLGRRAETEGIVQRFDDSQPKEVSDGPSKDSDTIAKPRLSPAEVIARLEQIKSALRAKVIELSKRAS